MPRKGRFFMGCIGVSFLLFLAGCGKICLMSCIEKNADVLNRVNVQLGGRCRVAVDSYINWIWGK